MSINQVSISGNLVKDAEFKTLANDNCACNFCVAVNDRRKQGDEWVEVANYVDCAVYGARARALAKYLHKGTKVAVSGKLRYYSWEKNDQKFSKVAVDASEIEFMNKRQEVEQNDVDEIPF